MAQTSSIKGCLVFVAMMISAGAVYVVSIYQAYQSGGNWLIIVIPVFGQIFWFVVRWKFFGPLNNYTYICIAFVVFGTWAELLNDAFLAKRSLTPEEEAERDMFLAEHRGDIDRIAAEVKQGKTPSVNLNPRCSLNH